MTKRNTNDIGFIVTLKTLLLFICTQFFDYIIQIKDNHRHLQPRDQVIVSLQSLQYF